MSNARSPRLAKSVMAIRPSSIWAPSSVWAPSFVQGPALRRHCVAVLTLLFVAVAGGGWAAEPQVPLSGVVNLNTASIEELKLLPGVGEARAEAIVTLRAEHGGFKSVDELLGVKGVGPSLMKRLRPHVTLKGATTAVKL